MPRHVFRLVRGAAGLLVIGMALHLVARPVVAAEPAQSSAVAQPPTDAELARYRAAADYSRSAKGEAVLVMHRGRIVFEEYYNDYTADRPHLLASGTKSFSGAMAVAAVADRLLTLDEPACATLDEWQPDPRKSKISIRHLLSLTSGLDAGAIGQPPSYADAIAARAKFAPGERFEYGPVPYQVFGEIMRRKLADKQESPLDYLRRRVLAPIGLTVGSWRLGRDGNPTLPSGAALTAREWVKFGELLRLEGAWEGQPVLRPDVLRECFRPGAENPRYGLTFWLGPAAAGDAEDERAAAPLARRPATSATASPAGFVMAAGAGKQRLYVIPSRDLVVVHFANSRTFRDDEFLSRLLGAEPPAP